MNPGQDKLSALDEAAVDAYETQLLDLLYEIEEEERVVGFYIGEEGSGFDGQAEAANAERINMLCEVLGIVPNKLADAFIAAQSANGYINSSLPLREIRKVQRHGKSIGAFMVQLAWNALPIERDESGDGTVNLSLRCQSGNILRIDSDGSFETDYPPVDSDESSELIVKIKYTASVLPPNQTEV